MFSDLKRHDMNPALAETLEPALSPLEIPNSHFVTARRWGIADTAPYLHDGRAATLYQAIRYHGARPRRSVTPSSTSFRLPSSACS